MVISKSSQGNGSLCGLNNLLNNRWWVLRTPVLNLDHPLKYGLGLLTSVLNSEGMSLESSFGNVGRRIVYDFPQFIGNVPHFLPHFSNLSDKLLDRKIDILKCSQDS
mgnify:FL=1